MSLSFTIDSSPFTDTTRSPLHPIRRDFPAHDETVNPIMF